MAFELPKLDYGYSDLEPYYDAQTVEIHHSKHHQAYTNNFNKAVEAAQWGGKSVEEILKDLDKAPEAHKTALRNHGGGYYNHNIFWKSMAPKSKGGGEPPKDKLMEAITQKWGNFEAFKDALSKKAAGHFGSGWAWLVLTSNKELEIIDTHDQICPLTLGYEPLLALDVWEHAYYLKYQNRRPEWISAFFEIANFRYVEELYIEKTK